MYIYVHVHNYKCPRMRGVTKASPRDLPQPQQTHHTDTAPLIIVSLPHIYITYMFIVFLPHIYKTYTSIVFLPHISIWIQLCVLWLFFPRRSCQLHDSVSANKKKESAWMVDWDASVRWVMSHIGSMSHVTHRFAESCHTSVRWVMSHIWRIHVSRRLLEDTHGAWQETCGRDLYSWGEGRGDRNGLSAFDHLSWFVGSLKWCLFCKRAL